MIFSKTPQDKKTREQWAGKYLDRVIVAGRGKNFMEDSVHIEKKLGSLGLQFNKIEVVGNKYKPLIIRKRNGIRLFREILGRLSSAPLKKISYELHRTVALPEVGISGGVRALVIADTESPGDAKIYLIGVGARKSKGHFYDHEAKFEKHALEDRRFLIDFSRKKEHRVIATDRVLSRFLRRYGPRIN